MPVTRASSKQPNRHDPFPEAQRKRRSPDPDGVILLTSDEENGVARKGAKRSSKHQKSVLNTIEVIEISDDDESAPLPPRLSKKEIQLQELRLQLETLRENNAKMEKELEHTKAELEVAQTTKDLLSKEVAELKLLQGSSKSKSIHPSELEDQITCEICTMKMWRPYILPDCGHSFCESCLQDWFGTTLARHMQSHPGFDINQPRGQIPAHLRNMMPYQQYHPQLQLMFAQYNQQNPLPEYTCPTCRVEIRSRPVEDYSLKAVVRVVAKAQGEASPQKPPPSGTPGRGKKAKQAAPQRKSQGPWDTYFPDNRAT